MASPYHHSMIHARKYGGVAADYVAIDNWFDQTKQFFPSWQHRMVLHNGFGIHLCLQHFGDAITNSDGKKVPVRLIAEDHIRQDFGFIPSLELCISNMGLPEDPKVRRAFMGGSARQLSKEVAEEKPSLPPKEMPGRYARLDYPDRERLMEESGFLEFFNPHVSRRLLNSGYRCIEQVRQASDEQLLDVAWVGPVTLPKIRKALEKQNENDTEVPAG